MNFKVDENLPAEVAAMLRDSGFGADTVGDENLSGAADEQVAGVSRSESRILLINRDRFTTSGALGGCGSVVRRVFIQG